jgi:hypothetical protein
MTIEAPNLPVSHEDRPLASREAVQGPLQEILDAATTNGWGTIEIISAMEEVLQSLRTAYAEAPDPDEAPRADW